MEISILSMIAVFKDGSKIEYAKCEEGDHGTCNYEYNAEYEKDSEGKELDHWEYEEIGSFVC